MKTRNIINKLIHAFLAVLLIFGIIAAYLWWQHIFDVPHLCDTLTLLILALPIGLVLAWLTEQVENEQSPTNQN
jgi:Kef-type K+ transport system membrane component KefB